MGDKQGRANLSQMTPKQAKQFPLIVSVPSIRATGLQNIGQFYDTDAHDPTVGPIEGTLRVQFIIGPPLFVRRARRKEIHAIISGQLVPGSGFSD